METLRWIAVINLRTGNWIIFFNFPQFGIKLHRGFIGVWMSSYPCGYQYLNCLRDWMLVCAFLWVLYVFNFRLPEWFAFIGQQADLGLPGSPYAITFRSRPPEASRMELMNVSVYSCGDTSLGCSCGDCPASPVCSDLEPPSPHEKDPCSISIGSLKVWIFGNILAVLVIHDLMTSWYCKSSYLLGAPCVTCVMDSWFMTVFHEMA